MSIIGGFVLPHPPLAVAAVGGGREKEIARTLEAFDKAASMIAELKPETLVFITPHSVIYEDYFHISPGKGASGDLSRFGAGSERFSVVYDEELVAALVENAEAARIAAGTDGERDRSLDHGVTVPLWFINKRVADFRCVRISQSGLGNANHYLLGVCLKNAADRLDRRVAVIASGDLSHRLTASGPYGYAKEGPVFDEIVTRILDNGDFLSLLGIPEDLREKAGECGLGSIVFLAGCFDKQAVACKLLSYEGPLGVGYGVASVIPGKDDPERDILGQAISTSIEASFDEFDDNYHKITSSRDMTEAMNEAYAAKASEDAYRALARASLEQMVRKGKRLTTPVNLPDELSKKRAGVFVTLYKEGQLRGCIGTIMPTRASVGEEIIHNAVSAGLGDPRFEPVTKDELAYLIYKVDVLMPPEKIDSIKELDAKRYGVIVTCGSRRGLLLPNLEGVDTVEEQVAIACQKGGIRMNEAYTLERFEVIRHE